MAEFANLNGSQLTVRGTRTADRVRVDSTQVIITVSVNGRTRSFLKSKVSTLLIRMCQGDDRLELRTDLPSLLHGDGGNDTILGGSGSDSIYSGSDNDRVYGGGGDDLIDTFNGDDMIAPGLGRDSIQAGAGTDEISYGDRVSGVDIAFEYRVLNSPGLPNSIVSEVHLNVGAETDQASDAEVVTGSQGDDTLSMVGVRAVLGAAVRDETLFERTYRINGGRGNDLIDVTLGASSLPELETVTRQLVDGGDGNDTLRSMARGETTLLGGSGDDEFISTSEIAFEPSLDAGEGIDHFHFVATHSLYFAMTQTLENFTLRSVTEGHLQVFGNTLSNRIVIEGSAATVYVDARYGNDFVDARLITSAQSVEIRGGLGEDTILGSPAGDLLFGGSGEDYLFGAGGIDTIHGDAHDDALDGGIGADLLYGGGGIDRRKNDPGDAVVDAIEVVV